MKPNIRANLNLSDNPLLLGRSMQLLNTQQALHLIVTVCWGVGALPGSSGMSHMAEFSL